MRLSMRWKIFLSRLVLIIVAVPLLLAAGYRIYGAGRVDALNGVDSFWDSKAAGWVVATVAACGSASLLLSLLSINKAGERLTTFANHIKEQGMIAPASLDDFPELTPIVDALRQKEKLLAKEVVKMNWIIKHIPGGLITINDREEITLFNCPAFEPLGILPEHILGKHIRDWHAIIQVQRHESPLLAALYRGTKSRMTLKIGDHYFDGVNTPMVTEDGTIDGAVCLFIDATERVKQEIELKRLDNLHLVGQMAASLGHEIRNPLTVIRGFIQMASKRTEHESNSHFHMMLQEIDRINDILAEFLHLAKDRSVEKCPGTLDTIVKQILPLLESESAIAGVELRHDLQASPELMLNSGDIKQMILNLHRNAIDACQDRGGMISIATGVDAKQRPFLRVKDTGCGISDDLIARLGTPFVSTKESGTGLGLSVCYSIASTHKAMIEVSSTVDEGTDVTVIFPAPDHNQTR